MDTAAQPRSRNGGPALVPWEGCALVEVDGKNPKYIPANASVVLKVELKGWPDISDDVPECRLGARVPIDVIANLEFTRDDLHRRYGPGIYFVHAYVAGDGEKGTTLGTPIIGQTHEIEALDFDNVKDSDPTEEEDDVGTQAWRVPPSALVANPEIKEEIARRREVRRELGIGEEKRSGDRDRGRGGRMGSRGRDRDRGRSGGRGRDWGPDGDDDDRGRGFDDEPEEPEEVYDPSWMHPEAPPGKRWYFCGNPIKWRLMDAGSAQAAPAAPPPPAGFFAGVDPEVKTLVVGGVVAMLKGLFDKVTADKPDPTRSTVELMAALRPPQTDPAELKRMELEAEDRRARIALEAEERRIAAAQAAENARIEREERARAAQAEAAEKQRAHDAKMEADRREAARIEAIAAEERAKQRAIESRNELITLQRLGLDPNAKPQRSEEEIRNAIKAEMLVEQLKKERDDARGSGDIASQIKRAEAVLKAAGIDVASEASKSMLMEFFNTEAGKVAAIQGLGMVDRLMGMLMAPKGAPYPQQPAPVALPPGQQGPSQEQIDAWAAAQREAGRQEALAQLRAEQQAAWEAQQAQAAVAPPTEAPAVGQWRDAGAPPEAPPAPVEAPEAPAEPEAPPPVEEPAQEPEAPAPAAEPDPEPEAPAVAVEAPRALPVDLPTPDPNSIIDQQPEAAA